MDGKSTAKLADFGLAKIYQESSLSGLSVTGQMGGTLAYMPPEQITHFREAKPAADIYAAGATLYTLLTGRKIFDIKGRPELQVAQILFEDPAPIQSHRPEIPDALAAIVHKSLAKAPNGRFPDAWAMRGALKRFVKRVDAPDRSGMMTTSKMRNHAMRIGATMTVATSPATIRNVADLLDHLGGIDPNRVRMMRPLGLALSRT